MPQKEHMLKAILLAKESVQNGGYAIGAVVVKNDEIISTGISRVKVDNDPTAHAEMIAIREACKIL